MAVRGKKSPGGQPRGRGFGDSLCLTMLFGYTGSRVYGHGSDVLVVAYRMNAITTYASSVH